MSVAPAEGVVERPDVSALPEPPEPREPPELPEDGAAGAGPMATAVPGVLAFEGSTIDTASPARTVGRFGLSGTVTIRRSVVAWYGCCPSVAAWPGAAFCAPARTAEGRNTTWPRGISPGTGEPFALCQRSTASSGGP